MIHNENQQFKEYIIKKFYLCFKKCKILFHAFEMLFVLLLLNKMKIVNVQLNCLRQYVLARIHSSTTVLFFTK